MKKPTRKSSTAVARERGERVVMLTLPAELVERIDQAAASDERSRNYWVRQACIKALEQEPSGES